MKSEQRAVLVFTALGAAVTAAIVLAPRLAGGEGGVAALPVVDKAVPGLVEGLERTNNAPRLMQTPTLSKTTIAFVLGGEIWTVPREGGTARRLVSGQLRNGSPRFSPDGSMIAFTGGYDGNADVYVVPAIGGEPKRLTYHPGGDLVAGWTPDGSKILFVSARATGRDLPKLYTVPVGGGQEEALPLAETGFRAAYAPDGRLAYEPFFQWQPGWKRYRGGQTARIWIADLGTSKVTKVPRENSNDKNPLWVDNTLYFLSDRNGTVDLFKYDGSKVLPVAKDANGFDYRSAQAGPGAIVIERLGQIALVDPASGAVKPVPITIADDLPLARPRFVKIAPPEILHATLSPSGKRVLLEAHGEILNAPVEKGDVRNVTQSPAIADRDPAWSPDGKWIAWLSDRSGEYGLYFAAADGTGPQHVVKLESNFFYAPQWSPDSKKLLLLDKDAGLWLIDTEKPTPTKIDHDPHDEGPSIDASWSPDSKWVLYTKRLPSKYHAAYVYNVDDKKSHQLTDGRSDVRSPRFDRGGKYIWFLASTNLGPAIGGFEMTSDGRIVTSAPYALVLDKTTPSPMLPESDEETAPKPPEKPSDKPAAVTIDFDNLDQRVVALPIDRANYVMLEAGAPGTFYLGAMAIGFDDETATDFDPGNLPGVEVTMFSAKARKADGFIPKIDPVGIGVSADGSKLLYRAGFQWFVVAADHPPKPGEGAIKAAGLDVWVEPRAEWRQMFHEAWRLERDFLYDPKAHGLDLAEAERVYSPFVDGLASRNDLNVLFEEMLGNLVLGHVFVGGGTQPGGMEPTSVGLLGADYKIVNGKYQITHILHGENWNPKLTAPLTMPGVVVKEGDFLLSVNGHDVSTALPVEAAFLGTAGKQTVLSVADNADGKNPRRVIVVPVPNDGDLRQRDWMEANRKKVDELSHGKVGYVFIPDTGAEGFANFNRYYFSQTDKQGMVLDARFNHGGQMADYMIEAMQRKLLYMASTRAGEDQSAPSNANYGPKVMIANQMSGSGGDMLPAMFKRAKLGPLVGMRTWGGLVGIGGYPPLIDGGMITAPRFALWNSDGKYDIENIGVAPDIEVEQDPSLMRDGHDPQLEKAVALVLEALEKNPPQQPKRPTPPDYGPRLPKP